MHSSQVAKTHEPPVGSEDVVVSTASPVPPGKLHSHETQPNWFSELVQTLQFG